MGNGDLLKLSQDFHKKIDENDTRLHGRLNNFGEKLGSAVSAIHKTADKVKAIMDDRPCALVNQVSEELDGHVEGHAEAKRDVKGIILTVVSTVIGLVPVALILYQLGVTNG